MADINKIKDSLLNQLASEIIVLSKELNILWINDSAVSSGWLFNDDDSNQIAKQFDIETSHELTSLLKDCIASGASITKRGFKLSRSTSE